MLVNMLLVFSAIVEIQKVLKNVVLLPIINKLLCLIVKLMLIAVLLLVNSGQFNI